MPKNKINVLYIEDEENQRKSFSKILKFKGYNVNTASSGKMGLEILKKNYTDVILCDLNMPRINGLEVLKRAKTINPEIPIILLTAHGTISDAVQAIKQGAFDYTVKPLQIDDIKRKISKALEKSDLQKKLQISESTLKMIMDTVPDIVYSLDQKGNFLSVNSAVRVILGYKNSEVLGHSVFDFIHPEDRKQVKTGFLNAIKEKDNSVRRIEFRMISKTGEVKYFEVNGQLIIENGHIVKANGIARDVTNRKLLQEELKQYSQNLERKNKEYSKKAKELKKTTFALADANVTQLVIQEELEIKNAEMQKLLDELSVSKGRLQTILDTSPNLIIMVDHDNQIVTINRIINEFFGVKIKDVIKKPFSQFLDRIKGCFENFDEFLQFAKEGESIGKQLCLEHKDLDPAEFYKRSSRLIKPKSRIIFPIAIPVFDDHNELLGKIWFFNDITVLKRANDRIHAIIEASPIPLIITSLADGKILFANKHLADLVGLTTTEVIGQDAPDFYYDPGDRKIVLEKLEKDGYLNNHELRIKKADGEIIWMIFSLVRTELDGESVVIGGLYDIHERKQAETALQESEERLRTVVSSAPIVLFALDRDGIFTFSDGKGLKVLGLNPNEIVGQSVFDVYRNVPKIIEYNRRALSGESFTSTVEIENVIFETHFSSIKDENNEVVGVIGVSLDITERKEAEKALQESEERFRGIVENANDIIYSLTIDGDLSYVSPNWKNILGHDVSEVTGKNISVFVHPEDIARCVEFLQKVMQSGEKQGGIEYRVKHKNGTWRWHSSNASVLKDKEGNVLYFLGIAHDITERKKFLK